MKMKGEMDRKQKDSEANAENEESQRQIKAESK